MCTKDGQLLCNIVPWLSLFRNAVIMEIKQTKIWEIIMHAVLKLQICANHLFCGISAGLWTPNFVKLTWTNNVQMDGQCTNGVLTVIFQTTLHDFFFLSEMHIWLTHMFHVHLLHRWGPLRSTWQMQVWTQITVHTLFIATSRWHIFALNSLTCA